MDAAILGDRRRADAALGDAATRAEALQRIEGAMGLPGAPGSLTDRIARFDSALLDAASRPDLPARMEAVQAAAAALAQGIAGIAQEVQQVRRTADAAIARDVADLAAGLERVADLNRQILRLDSAGQPVNALIDMRQQEIDRLAEIVPLRELARPNGQVALYTEAGAALLDGRVAAIGFTPAAEMGPELSLQAGTLSGLTLNGSPISTGAAGLLSGGRLGARFAVRDSIAPAAQSDLDALAAGLMLRFQAADAASAAPLGTGLFTDDGAAFDPMQLAGLAQRLQLNAAVDPGAGGAVWRLRDGLGAAAPGVPGDATLLIALQAALTAPAPGADPGFPGLGFAGQAAALQSGIGTARDGADAARSFSAGRADTLRQAQLREGVDTDAELQKLLLIERAYAANARVVRSADEMLQTLLSI